MLENKVFPLAVFVVGLALVNKNYIVPENKKPVYYHEAIVPTRIIETIDDLKEETYLKD
jgi:hypothetical protein